MQHIVDTIITLLLITFSSHSLHIISPDTTSIPYLIPRFFQNACDPSDVYFSEEETVAAIPQESNIISFVKPPQNVTSANIRRTPNIWTHEPFCLESMEAQDGLCVYTNAKFAKGRGISLVTAASEISSITRAGVFSTGRWEEIENSVEGEKKYMRKKAPGKNGFAIFANASIRRGEELHSLTPILAVQDPLVYAMTKEDQTLLIRVGVERLPAGSKNLFLSQFAEEGKDAFTDRVAKNAFNVHFGRSKSAFAAAVPETAVSLNFTHCASIFF
jgi:hypothetical protein